jgi:hypothetical protein
MFGRRGNAARKALRPVLDRLWPLHPRFLADDGDSGTPWYEMYVVVDSTPDLEETIRSVAREAGYLLDAGLVTTQDGRTLAVTIVLDGQLRVAGATVSTPAGRAIVVLRLSLP